MFQDEAQRKLSIELPVPPRAQDVIVEDGGAAGAVVELRQQVGVVDAVRTSSDSAEIT